MQNPHVWPAIRDFHERHATDFDPLLSADRASQRFVEPPRWRRIVIFAAAGCQLYSPRITHLREEDF